MNRVGWRLTLEPEGTLLAWSLIRVEGDRPSTVWSGLQTDASPTSELVASLHGADPWDSPLADPTREAALARDLGLALLPGPLRAGLLAADGSRHTLTIAVRGWPALVPWDLLALDWSGNRVLERAQVLAGPSPGLVATSRPRPADAASGTLWVVDPGPASGEFAPLFPAGVPRTFTDAVGADDCLMSPPHPVTPDGLGAELRGRPWRALVYLGHLRPAPEGTPAAAALVLGGSGPAFVTARDWLAEPGRWPAPRHTALIGCSGDDARPHEQSGLVAAALGAGAEVVVTTRWSLPNDDATARLAAAVALAQESDDPAPVLRRWQELNLRRWRETGDPGNAPLVWASLVVYDLPRLRAG